MHTAYATGNFELASQLAISAGYTVLATLLASGPSCQGDVAGLLQEVAQTKELKSVANPSVARLLQNAAGQGGSDDEAFRRGEKTLDWRRRLAIRIRQRPDDSLLEILDGYEASLIANEVPFPFPSYHSGSLSSTNTKSMFYRLLHICADPTSMSVVQAIDPSGYTPHVHDFYLPFHLASALTSVPEQLFHISQYDIEYIKDGYANQLILQGYWERAVFVLLFCIGECYHCGTSTSMTMMKEKHRRWEHYIYLARNLIFRYFDTKHDPFAEHRRSFLTKVGIPSYWFDEATCYRLAAVDGDVPSCIESMYAFDTDLWRDAFVSFVCPKYMLHRNESDVEKLLLSLNITSSGAAPDLLATAVYRYVALEKSFMSYRETFHDGEVFGNTSDIEELQSIQENANSLYDVLTTLASSSQAILNLDFMPSMDKNTFVPFEVMVSEMLGNVTEWKSEISSVARVSEFYIQGKLVEA